MLVEEGLCSGHRITVGVTGLDTSVRCYSLTHILTGPFWLERVSGNHHSASHWYVCRLMTRESFGYGWLWLCPLVKGSNWNSKTEIIQDFETPKVNVITLICLRRLFFFFFLWLLSKVMLRTQGQGVLKGTLALLRLCIRCFLISAPPKCHNFIAPFSLCHSVIFFLSDLPSFFFTLFNSWRRATFLLRAGEQVKDELLSFTMSFLL